MCLRLRMFIVCICVLPLAPALAAPIISAQFEGDFASLQADRFVAGTEVNSLVLTDATGTVVFDLSNDFFGDSDVLLGTGTRKIDQCLLCTGIVSVPIPMSFFPVLATGQVLLSFRVTDTGGIVDTADDLFAMDYLALRVNTATDSAVAFVDENNGFGIGLPDGAMLPAPLPISIPSIGVGGDGFDESLNSKNLQILLAPVPEPSSIVLLGIGLVLGFVALRRKSAR